MQQGLQQGKLEEARTAVLEFLESRFNARPAQAAAALDAVQDLELLKRLRREVFRADTLEEALSVIDRAARRTGEH
ncbi:MAG: hypothetical protein H5U00_09330 [Clostridia bacterium]|nr:hypothetical protein [Clostridia bacterium]